MTKPLYQVGEEVVIHASGTQEHGMEAVITIAKSDRLSSGGFEPNQIRSLYKTSVDMDDQYWGDKHLRKKHKPYNGEVFDFSEEDLPYKTGEKV